MTLSELRYLVAVADLQHFGRAAERCHVTQPTLSTQLRKLEEYLGVTLIERTHRAVVITPIGRRIVMRARRILEEADQICQTARHDKGLLASTVRLGIIPTAGPYLLPLFLRPLHEAYPDLRLVLREDLTGNLLRDLAAYELDALLLALPVDAEGCTFLPLFEEPFWFACPPTHRLANKPAVTEADLGGEHLLLLSEGHCLRDQALAICGDHARDSANASDDVRASSLETIGQMVAAGLGCTLLPALAVQQIARQGGGIAVRPFQAALDYRRLGLVWRTSFPRTDDLLALGRFIQEHLPEAVRATRDTPADHQRSRMAKAS
ncbi:MAG: hydrogen peroxide-inducible genes activator [Alphaproteobacteria bacterium]|nr:hydrogen peroxide-inducible genes activator [Alphaproteobacteria bacterium]